MPSIQARKLQTLQEIVKRQYYNNCGYYSYGCGWSTGTRVGVGVAIAVGIILLVILCSCAAKRRRRNGLSSTRPMFGAPSAYFGGGGNNQQQQQQQPVNVLPQQSPYQSYPAYDPTNVQDYNQHSGGGYYPQTGNAGYQYPPPSFGNREYAPPDGPPPAEDTPYQPPSHPPPVYKEGAEK